MRSASPLQLCLLQPAVDPRIPHHRFELQNVILPHFALVLLPELLCELLASRDILWADEIDSDLHGIGHVGDLLL